MQIQTSKEVVQRGEEKKKSQLALGNILYSAWECCWALNGHMINFIWTDICNLQQILIVVFCEYYMWSHN